MTGPPYTKKQGRYLAFIYYYTKLNVRPPAERDMQWHFRTTPPAVHDMVKALHERGLKRADARQGPVYSCRAPAGRAA